MAERDSGYIEATIDETVVLQYKVRLHLRDAAHDLLSDPLSFDPGTVDLTTTSDQVQLLLEWVAVHGLDPHDADLDFIEPAVVLRILEHEVYSIDRVVLREETE